MKPYMNLKPPSMWQISVCQRGSLFPFLQ